MGNRSVGRLSRFALIAVVGAALFAFSPLIGPVLSGAPASFRDLLASAADVPSSDTLTSSDESGAATGKVLPDAAGANGSGAPVQPVDSALMTVDYVHDGDTLFLLPAEANAGENDSGRLKVRLIGLDTPEIGDHAECFGMEATDQLRALLPEGTSVGVTADIEPLDQYGRSLFYLWTADGRFVNYELVAAGAAHEVSYAPNERYVDLFRSAEQTARSARVGLWGSC